MAAEDGKMRVTDVADWRLKEWFLVVGLKVASW